jgi:hypothetical protein
MLILAAVAALALPFTAISAVIDVLSYRSGLIAARAPGAARPHFPRRAVFAGLILSASIFGLIFAAHNLIPGKAVWTKAPYDTKPIGLGWSAATLMTHRGNDAQSRIDGISVWGENLGPEQPTLKSAQVISGIDGAIVEMQVGDNINGLIDPKDAAPIPVGAQFEFYALFEKNSGVGDSGLTIGEFNQRWGIFRVVVWYDGGEIQHDFTRDWVNTALASVDPRLRPHVSKRRQ